MNTGGMVPIRDFAAVLRTSVAHVARLCRVGEIPGVKVNGRWFVPLSDWGREHVEAKKLLGRTR